MEQKKTRTYLLYAMGEITLVVVGILIALQVSNWNTKNTDQRISNEYHQRMISDIDQQFEGLNAEVERAGNITESLSQAVKILEQKEFNDSTMVILDSAIRRYFQLAPVSFQISSYEEMKSTGRLNLIYNIELRQQLNAYSSFALVISSIVDQLSGSVNGSNDLFNQYIRVYITDGSDRQMKYDPIEISSNPVVINTLSRFAYDWSSYNYFLGVVTQRMNEVRDNLQQEIQTF